MFNPPPYRSGDLVLSPMLAALYWRTCCAYVRLRLELYHPRAVTRWN